MRPFLLIILLLTLPALVAGQAVPVSTSESAEARDLILMLDGGPLHVQLQVTLRGRSLSDLRQEFVDRLIASLDKDEDGVVSRSEAAATPLLTMRRRDKAAAFLASLDQNRAVPRSELETSVRRVGGETIIFRQDETAAENDLEVYRTLDRDGSGLLEPPEIAQAALHILEKDGDGDECVMFDEFVTPPEPEMQTAGIVEEPLDEPRPTVADRMRAASEPLLPRRLIYRYDRNRDGRLSADELNWSDDRLSLLDADGDGNLSTGELSQIARIPVDLALAVELAPEEGQRAISVLSVTGERADDAARPDFARLQVGGTSLSVSHRPLDPIETAVSNALAEFNRMDADANGYLDPEEASLRTRFERGLFDTIDADGDAKIFAEEMRHYVELRAAPSATSCQVNLYDIGRGFFSVLDRNGDGRISVREMRAAEDSLSALASEPGSPVTINDPARSFHIEFVRGSYQLFGRPESMIAQSPSFVQRPSAGPIWFRRMDRNNDGDLTWNEFLGPRYVYQELDADGDGLLDANEAEAAGS